MANQSDYRMVIDERLESYTTFFDHDWARRIMDLAAGTRLDDCVFSLCVNWKAAANVHIVPWFTVTSMGHFAEGMTKAHEPLTVKIIKAMAARLLTEMGDSLRNMQRKKLADAIATIGKEVSEGLERQGDQEELKPEFYWQMYLGSQYPHEFRLIVWGSQRICYGRCTTPTRISYEGAPASRRAKITRQGTAGTRGYWMSWESTSGNRWRRTAWTRRR